MKILPIIALLLPTLLHASDPTIEELLKNSGDEMAVEGRDGWRFLTKELNHLLADKPVEGSDAVEAIADFSSQLSALGIRLLVVPVPPKAAVEAARLGLETRTENPDEPTLLALEQKGVEVINLWPSFLNAPVYLQRDSHWNPEGIAIAADKIAAALEGIVSRGTAPPSREDTVEIQGDLGGDPEEVRLRFVEPQGEGQRFEPDRDSPVLVFGDSHVLVFHEGGDMHAASAGLPEQIALALHSPVDVLAVRGSGATAARISLARRARSNPDWLKNKKAVVWCLGAREFTQADRWAKIPLLP